MKSSKAAIKITFQLNANNTNASTSLMMNELNRTNILWTIRHEWPEGARFTFNCYCHHGMLLCCAPDGNSCTLHSKEGGTQGDPLSIFTHGGALMHMVRDPPKKSNPRCVQPWYADDAGSAGLFDEIEAFFEDLVKLVLISATFRNHRRVS